jgi:lysophospholipase L1-like esterase
MTTAIRPAKQTERPSGPQAVARHSWWQLPLSVAALLLVSVTVLEVFFNACGVGMEEILQPDPVFGTVHIPGKKVIWRMEGFSNESFNAQGMRDLPRPVGKPANVMRIALLGDSATEGLQVALMETYGQQLEQILNQGTSSAAAKEPLSNKTIEVLNFGCSGYSTGQEVLQFERQIASYSPDLVLLLYNRGDNVENIRRPDDLRAEPRPYFYVDQAGALKEDDAVLIAQKAALAPHPVQTFLRNNSRIYGVFSHANLNMSISEPLFRKLRGWVLFPFTAMSHQPVHCVPAYPPQDGWKVTAALIQRLDNDCRDRHAKLVVASFPNTNNDPEFASQIVSLDKLSKSTGFDFFDLTPLFRWNKNPMSLFLKYHFSAKGHRLVAEQLAEFLNDHTFK